MRLVLVRHGDAHAGLHGVIAGRLGCRGLTDLGREQATLLRDRLAADPTTTEAVLLASSLPRAVETARIISPTFGTDEVPEDCDLCEVHTGVADGMEWTEHSTRFGSFDMAAEPDRVFAPGGDSWNTFHARVHGAMHRLADEYRDRTLFAVCHAGVIAASVVTLLGVPLDSIGAGLRPTNTGLTEWEYDPDRGRWTLRFYNDAHHLGTG